MPTVPSHLRLADALPSDCAALLRRRVVVAAWHRALRYSLVDGGVTQVPAFDFNAVLPGAPRLVTQSPDAIPDYQSLMLHVLRAAESGEVRIGDVVHLLGNLLSLSDEQKGLLLPSGRQTLFANRVHWAKTYLAKAGLVELTRRGHFRLSDRGRNVLSSAPSRIDNKFLDQFDEFRRFARPQNTDPGSVQNNVLVPSPIDEVATPDEIMRTAHRRIEAELAQELLDRICSASPEFFERLIVNLLLAMGYGGSIPEAGRALGRSGDGGIDGVIDQDTLGLDRVYIQAKRYAAGNAVGSGAVRDFFGSLDRHKAAKGVFVTTSTFSKSAQETADYLSKRIVLIDGPYLTRLMIQYNIGCRISETLHLKKVDEEFFD